MINCTRLFATASILCLLAGSAAGQGGLRESLEKLDRNRNGVIEPTEITPLARPYFEQIGSMDRRGFQLDEPHKISEIQEFARRYYAMRNGANRERPVRIDRESGKTVLPFGRKPNESLIPEFGLAEVKFPYTQDDLDFADRTLRSHDENKDGFIDRDEASRHEWTHRNPFADDLNKDERLSRLEMAQRYARRRLLNESAREIRKKDWREREMTPRASTRSSSSRYSTSSRDYWLTSSLFSRFDRNRNQRLEPAESASLGLPLSQIDTNRDGNLSRDELFAYLKDEQSNAGGGEAAPDWFLELDANRDGQVDMPEYSSEWTEAKLAEFEAIDVNQDGLLTIAEASSAKPKEETKFRNDNTELLAPRRTIISEIEIKDDLVVGDLNVQLSITHTYVGTLDVYLTGPNGRRIELFTAVGGSGDHFDNTMFDDQSKISIAKGKAPYRGSFQTEGAATRQGLSVFNGKPAKGLWQLVIRSARSDRFGVLHGWRLHIAPEGSPAADTTVRTPTKPATLPPTSKPPGITPPLQLLR